MLVLSALLAGAPARYATAQAAEVAARVEPRSVLAGRGTTVVASFTFPEGLHQTRQDEYFFVRLAGVSGGRGISADPVEYPEGPAHDGEVWYSSPVELRLPLDVDASLAPGVYTLELEAGYQLCDDRGLCYFPHEETLAAEVEVFVAPGGGVWTTLRMLLLAFVGGLILNVMPCVLPVLSIKALSLVRESGEDRRSILLHSWSYAAGILVSFLVLAAIVVAVKASGELVGWGFQFQNPGFVVALLAVVFVFALSLFDVFVVEAPVGGLAARASGVRGNLGAFLTGTLAVLLATPCTAPFLGTALGYAFSQPAGTVFLMFAAVGIGLAFPFLLLGLWPAAVRRIPRPGAWTGVFRTLMGFLLIGTAVYLLDVLAAEVGADGVIRVVIFLATLGLAAWVYGRFGGPTAPRAQRWVALLAAVAIGVVGGLVTLRFGERGTGGSLGAEAAGAGPASAASVPEGWEPFAPQVVERYVMAGEPVFLAFGARWCWTCKANESTVLAAPEVRQAFSERGVHLVYGDYTNPVQTVEEWLESFGRAGVPLYVYYPPGGKGIVLPELLTRATVLGAIKG